MPHHGLLYIVLILVFTLSVLSEVSKPIKHIVYLTGQHNIVPEPSLVAEVTHVILAFMRSETFDQPQQSSWPLFTSVADVRPKFADGTAIMVAIGGWGDTKGFAMAARSNESRKLFARHVKTMIDETGADGVDIDWEYPGGNGEDYKTHPNSEKAWEIEAYPHLLAEIRAAIGPLKLISAAVPGLPRDMLAFTPKTLPDINKHVDFLNIMTYDLMNRRDNVTKHHTGMKLSLEAIDAYLDRGLPPAKANLGLAFYVKWFKTAADSDCATHSVGCRTELMEEPHTGADLGKAGAFSWHDEVPLELSTSFRKALQNGVYDDKDGGHYYWDAQEQIWWSWDTPEAIKKKFPAVIQKRGLGGVFAWGLGEDAPEWKHLKASTEEIQSMRADSFVGRDEL
ncbi:glycoside hydrolase superfamily [Massariosphaeria phaeospora]|uniref:chitinase n=1 Tax=Massariosphaeria phaeospora TaxID=100035 RepID=A0A7C8M2S4_9PLEO|nr:glycoside hydrolase superfamily [Massariosphaeria phaeospora]